jgi:hypothetical protein
MRFKRSLPLHAAGSYSHQLALQCLHALYDLSAAFELLGGTFHWDARDSGILVGNAAKRMLEVCEILRAYFDRDPTVSVGQAVRWLREFKDDLPPAEVRDRPW